MPLTNFGTAKYQRWYDGLMAKAKARQIPKLNTETHHIRPRSLGGSDEEANLIRLTYREHFVAHWLLTKVLSGSDLRKMQFALFAMTMCSNGTRIVSGWQYEVARRAMFEPIQLERARLEEQKRRAFDKEIANLREELAAVQSGVGRTSEGRVNLALLANKLTKYHKFIDPVEVADEPTQAEPSRRHRKSRPSKRARAALKARLEFEHTQSDILIT